MRGRFAKRFSWLWTVTLIQPSPRSRATPSTSVRHSPCSPTSARVRRKAVTPGSSRRSIFASTASERCVEGTPSGIGMLFSASHSRTVRSSREVQSPSSRTRSRVEKS